MKIEHARADLNSLMAIRDQGRDAAEPTETNDFDFLYLVPIDRLNPWSTLPSIDPSDAPAPWYSFCVFGAKWDGHGDLDDVYLIAEFPDLIHIPEHRHMCIDQPSPGVMRLYVPDDLCIHVMPGVGPSDFFFDVVKRGE